MLQLVRRRVFKWTHSPLKLIHGYTNFRAASIPTNHNEEMVEQSKTKQSVNTLFQQPLRNKIIASLQNLKKSYSSIFKTLMIACDDPEIREILIKSIPILEKIYVKWNTTRKDNIELDNLRNKLPDTLIVEALISLNVFSSLKSHAFDLLSRTKNPRFVLSIAILAYHCNAVTLNTSSTSSSHISKSILQFTDEESKRLIQALIENNSKPSTVQIWPILRQILQPYSIGTRGDYYRGEPVLQLSIEDFNQIVKTIARSSTSEALTWCHLILESLVNSSPSVHSSAYTSTDTPSSSSSSVALSNILSPNLYTFKIMVTIAATSAWENLFYFLSRMRAAGFAPDMGLYNKLIDSCNASPETRWKFARRFLLEAAVLDKNRSKTMTTAGDAQISTFSSTTGRALSIILHGATHTTRKVSDTGMKSTQPGTAANAIAVIHTWNELQKISGTQSDSMSKDVSLAFYNIEAVSNHTVGTLALSAVLTEQIDLAIKMVDQVVKNAPKVSAISSTSGKANNVSTMDVSTMDVSTDVNNNDDKTPLSVASPLEQLVRDLVVCKAVHTMYDSVGALICVLIRKNRSDLIRKLWGRSLASAQEQAQLIGRTSRAAIYATTPMYQPFDDLLKIIKIVASSVVELDVSPAITQSTSVFITRALQQMQEGTTATVRSGQPRIIGSIRVTPDLCLLLMTLFESVGDYKSAKLLFQLSKTNKKFHNYSSLPGLLRMALKNRDYNFIFEMVEGSLNTSKTQLPSDNKEHILLKSSDPIENTENKSKQIYVASKSKPISYQLRSALFSPVLLSLAELNRPDLMYDILTVEMPRTNTKPSPSQVKIGMEALLATGHYEKGAELFFHFFEPEDSSSSSSSSIGTEISSKLLVTPSAVLVALECCASGGLGAQALRVLSTLASVPDLTTCAEDARVRAGVEMRCLLLTVRSLSLADDLDLLPQLLEIILRQGTQKLPRLVTPEVLSSCLAITALHMHAELTSQIIALSSTSGYRLNEDFFNSVKNECSALMTNKLDDVTQSARWIPIQTFLDVHLKPYIILAK